MKKLLLLSALLLSFGSVLAIDVPKNVSKGVHSVARVMTYRNGVLNGSGYAVFVGGGDLLASSGIFNRADSAVVIDSNGKVRPVKYITGVDEVFDCIRVRVATDKKIKPLAASSSKVSVGDRLYMLVYGVKGAGSVEALNVLAADSLYSGAYYTLDKPQLEQYVALPLLNVNGELVAFMQPSSACDTLHSYAVGQSVMESLLPTAMNYGRGYYDRAGIRIRTALPSTKEEALSCLYMQAMLGDSLSWLNVINDYIECYPKSYEGYLSLAEYSAIYYRDMERAETAWKKSLSLAKNKAEVHFGKAKAIASIVQNGDSTSHKILSFSNALAELDKAIKTDPQQLYINYKADLLYSLRRFDESIECYKSLEPSPDIYAKLSQCYADKGNLANAVAMLDSAVSEFGPDKRGVAPYILTRALVKVNAERYREAVIDFNRYEELAGSMLNDNFYYMRAQAELNCKMYQQALNDIETAIYLVPDKPLYYLEKGILCYRVKLADEGIRTMEKACELAPGIADMHYILGLLYIQKGNNVRAKESLGIAHELGHPDAARQLGSIK